MDQRAGPCGRRGTAGLRGDDGEGLSRTRPSVWVLRLCGWGAIPSPLGRGPLATAPSGPWARPGPGIEGRGRLVGPWPGRAAGNARVGPRLRSRGWRGAGLQDPSAEPLPGDVACSWSRISGAPRGGGAWGLSLERRVYFPVWGRGEGAAGRGHPC